MLFEMSDFLSIVFDSIRFIVTVILLFYIPGRLLLIGFNIHNNFLKEFFYSITSGMLAYTFLVYLVSWIHITDLFQYLYIAVVLLLVYKNRNILSSLLTSVKQLFPFLLIGFVFSLIITTRGIWQNNFVYERDDVIHLAYISEMVHRFPPDNPGFSNVPLIGYHFFHDFLIAKIHQVSTIPIHRLHFQFFPLLIGFLWALGTYVLGTVRGNSKSGWWILFFVLFGGSAAFLFHLFGYNQVSLNAGLGIDQPVTALLNGPYATSFVFILLFLTNLLDYVSTKKAAYLWLLSIATGLTPMFKIYGGLLLYAGLGMIGIHILFTKKWKHLLILMSSIILTACTFLLFSGQGNRLFYQPLWAPHAVLEFSLPWYGFHEKMYTYKQLSVMRGIITVELHGLILFLFGNLGTRLIGFILFMYFLLRRRIRLNYFDVVLFAMACVSIVIPLFFIQSGKVFEIIQFGWYYPLFVSIFAGMGFARLFSGIKNLKLTFLLIVLIGIMTLPTTYDSMKSLIFKSHVIAGENNVLITPKYTVMKKLSMIGTYDDTVLELPPLTMNHDELSIINWFRNTEPLMSYFANKRSFFTSQNIDFFNLNLSERAMLLIEILKAEKQYSSTIDSSNLIDDSITKIKHNSIHFIVSTDKLTAIPQHANVELIYSEDPYYVYQIH